MLCLLLLPLWTVATGNARAQSQAQVRITRLDTSGFPLIRINLLLSDGRSQPLTDMAALRLRENGIPLDFELASAPVGIDAILVLDVNQDFQQVDGAGGLTRQQAVQASIGRFATGFMNPTGLDRVTVIVPGQSDDQPVRFLVRDAASLEAVVTALDSYEPVAPGATRLNVMMSQALAHAAQYQDNGRFQAILLFTDGGQLHRQLDFPTLVERAQALHLPIFVAILGARVDPNEIENAARLYQPTRGFYVHMPEAAETDPIYALWQQHGNQPQIQYRSLQRRSGSYPIAINLGEARATTSLELAFVPPQVVIEPLPNIVRQGNAPDTPLASLEPITQTITIAVTWPDGLPRALSGATLLVNHQPQSLTGFTPPVDGRFTLEWYIQMLDEGEYELVAQVTDELGFVAESQPLPVMIEVARPLLPTPTVMPTAVPAPSGVVAPVAVPQESLLLFLALIGLVALALLWWRWRRRRAEAAAVAEGLLAEPGAPEVEPTMVAPDGAASWQAFLEPLDGAGQALATARLIVEGDNVAVGREAGVVQIVLTDKSVSPLHARIRKSGDAYWLYDEGSANGTYLNYERLGLAPHVLHDQDLIHLGHVSVRFRLAPPEIEMSESDKDEEQVP